MKTHKRPTRACDTKPFEGAVLDAFIVCVLSILGVLASHALVYYLWPWQPRHGVDIGFLLFTQGISACGAGLLSYLCASNIKKTQPTYARSMWRSLVATVLIVTLMSSQHALLMNAAFPGFLPHNALEVLSYQLAGAPLGYRWLGFIDPEKSKHDVG